MRRWLAEALTVRSEQQALLNHPEVARTAWNEAHKLFTMLHASQAQFQPTWLQPQPAKE
jgi:isopentenyldiphosphate isomerase